MNLIKLGLDKLFPEEDLMLFVQGTCSIRWTFWMRESQRFINLENIKQ